MPGYPSPKEQEYREKLTEAIMMRHPVRFTYASDAHATWRHCIPCRLGTMKSGVLTLEAYNPTWLAANGRAQPFKLFHVAEMDRLEVMDGETFNSFDVRGYDPMVHRFYKVEAELL